MSIHGSWVTDQIQRITEYFNNRFILACSACSIKADSEHICGPIAWTLFLYESCDYFLFFDAVSSQSWRLNINVVLTFI